MKLKEAKELKWGDYIYPSERLHQTFRQGKKITGGIFLGLKKQRGIFGNRSRTLLRVVTQDSATIYHYDPLFWETSPHD